MLTQIDVDSENAFAIPILGATPKDSLLVKQITGLDPPDVDLFIGDYARDGGTFQGRRVAKRNVVITFDLNPNYALGETVPGLRRLLYKSFLDPQVQGDYLKLLLHDDELGELYVVGYTEKLGSELFSSDTMAQISMICPDPYIRDNAQTVLTDDSGWTTVPYTYEGTAETGFETEIYVSAATSVLTLENNTRTMVFTHDFAIDDVVYVNTIRGQRAVMYASATNVDADKTAHPTSTVSERWARLVDLDQTFPLIASLSTSSPWLELHSQSNITKVYGVDDDTTPASIKTLAYIQSYWGI